MPELMRLSPWEMAGFLTGLACVWFVVKQRIWNFPLGIVSCGCFFILFMQQKLFGEATLQVLFIALGFHGWAQWLQRRQNAAMPGVTSVTRKETGLILLAFVPTTAILWWILITLSGSAPLIDALVTALSLVAQWLLNRKRIENWLVWIVVDVLTIGLGISREMYLLATLYMIFLGMCMVGWYQWRHTMIPQSDGDHV